MCWPGSSNIPSPANEKIAPRFTAADDPALTALRVLSHELGHILLGVTNADGTDKQHPRRKVRGAPISRCFDQAFLGKSWDTKRFRQSMTRWVVFGDQARNRQKNIRFNVSNLRDKAEATSEAVRSVYRSREFVSVVSAIRPESTLQRHSHTRCSQLEATSNHRNSRTDPKRQPEELPFYPCHQEQDRVFARSQNVHPTEVIGGGQGSSIGLAHAVGRSASAR